MIFYVKRPTLWLSGSGGTGETHIIFNATSGNALPIRAAEPLSDWSRCWAAHYFLALIM
jgi:hypothetical protein